MNNKQNNKKFTTTSYNVNDKAKNLKLEFLN